MDVSHAPSAHGAFLARAMSVLQSDPRFVGVAAGGSWIARDMDEFSDLDLVLAVAPPAFSEVSAAKMEVARSLGALLVGFSGEHVGEPRLLICLYEQPLLHVDLKFIALGDLARRVEDPVVLWERDGALTRTMSARPAVYPTPEAQWMEDRFWVWIHYAATKLGRGELFEVIEFLGFLRREVLGPLAALVDGQSPRGVRRLEKAMPRRLPAFERTLAGRDPKSCSAALFGAVELYRELRQEWDQERVTRRSQAEHAAVTYLAAIATPVG